jgi:hypothetical protein
MSPSLTTGCAHVQCGPGGERHSGPTATARAHRRGEGAQRGTAVLLLFQFPLPRVTTPRTPTNAPPPSPAHRFPSSSTHCPPACGGCPVRLGSVALAAFRLEHSERGSARRWVQIDYEKDVDGFHPLNMGFLAQRGRNPMYVACTPKGCIELLERSGVEIAGKNAVVIGRSNIVGMPATLLLMRRDATVTVVRITHLRLTASHRCVHLPAISRRNWSTNAIETAVPTEALCSYVDPSVCTGLRSVHDTQGLLLCV